MTLGIAYSLSGQPFVMGDLLQSGAEKDHEVRIPSIGNIESVYPKGSGFSITGLCQKVIVISRRLVITWAGSPLVAQVVISELRELDSKGLELQGLSRYLQALPAELKKQEFALTGWFIDPTDGSSYCINFDAEEMNYPPFESLTLIGSGTTMFQDLLRSRELVSGESRGLPPEQSIFLTHTFTLTGLLLELELKQKTDSLHWFFGGGYEVAICDDWGFRKFGEITSVYWDIGVTAQGVRFALPYYAQKQYYQDDDLIIAPLRLHAHADGHGTVESDVPYRVREPGKRSPITPVLSPDGASLNSRDTCHYFFDRGSGHVFLRYQYRQDPQDIGVFFSQTATGVQLRINKAFLESVRQSLMSNERWRTTSD